MSDEMFTTVDDAASRAAGVAAAKVMEELEITYVTLAVDDDRRGWEIEGTSRVLETAVLLAAGEIPADPAAGDAWVSALTRSLAAVGWRPSRELDPAVEIAWAYPTAPFKFATSA